MLFTEVSEILMLKPSEEWPPWRGITSDQLVDCERTTTALFTNNQKGNFPIGVSFLVVSGTATVSLILTRSTLFGACLIIYTFCKLKTLQNVAIVWFNCFQLGSESGFDNYLILYSSPFLFALKYVTQ